jgi:hypothetical protein
LFVGQSAITILVELVQVKARSNVLSEFDADDEIIIALVLVNKSKTMEHWITGLFFNHSVDHLVPAVKTISVGCSVKDWSMVKEPNVRFGVFEMLALVWVDGAMPMEKEMLMT